MPSAYLAVQEFGAYGVPTATQAQVTAASALVDSYLKRPEGLQWMPDAAGFPCYMAGLSPVYSLKSSQAISAGTNVSVPVATAPGMMTTTGTVGDVVVIDRANADVVEACVVQSVQPGMIVLANVVNAHSPNATIEFGLVIREQKSLPDKRSLTRVSSWPIARIHSILGTYRYGRRSQQSAGLFSDQNLLALMQTFGGPPEWISVDVSQADFNPTSGEVWIPSGVFLAQYSDVRLYYVAGFSRDNIPPIIKSVTASAILSGLATKDFAGGIKVAKAGDNMLERFSSTLVDDDMRTQLNLYKARMFF